VHFVDRVERRTVEQKKAEAAAEEERMTAAKAGISQAAYEMPIESIGLADHICNILTEADLRTVGDLMLSLNLGRDNVLGLAGIGPKSMQSIEEALAAVTFPEPEPVAAPEGLPAVEVQVEPVEASAEPVEKAEAPALAEAVLEPVDETGGKPVSTPEEQVEFEKMFSLQNVVATTPGTGEAPAEDEEGKDKKKEKKQRKDRAYQRDEDKDKVVAVKKHKRGDEALEEEW
jgi:hypothetical protein